MWYLTKELVIWDRKISSGVVTARLKYILWSPYFGNICPSQFSHSSLKTAIQKLMDQNHLYGTNLWLYGTNFAPFLHHCEQTDPLQ